MGGIKSLSLKYLCCPGKGEKQYIIILLARDTRALLLKMVIIILIKISYLPGRLYVCSYLHK